ncbi:hypothetical protein [Flavobacterium suncheonense]|nr:hypothetical protein [Flavobacterium suncheonense]
MKKVILFLSILVFIGCGNSEPNESNAKEAARAAIIHNLKNINSANFHQNEVIADLGGGVYQYKETVNATNNFGGSIANDVTVKVKYVGGDASEVSSWSILDIQFSER